MCVCVLTRRQRSAHKKTDKKSELFVPDTFGAASGEWDCLFQSGHDRHFRVKKNQKMEAPSLNPGHHPGQAANGSNPQSKNWWKVCLVRGDQVKQTYISFF